MAPGGDLDQDALCRCRSYTEALIEEGTSGDLWDNFGIVSELVVRQLAFLAALFK